MEQPCGGAGAVNYLGSIDQPPGVEQAEAVLVAVTEASLVGVPDGMMIFVLQDNRGAMSPWRG